MDFNFKPFFRNQNYPPFIYDILAYANIVGNKPKETQSFSLYEIGSLEYILKEDNVNMLKDYINSNTNIDIGYKITIPCNSPFILIIRKEKIIRLFKIPMLDFCSFYGSHECFKFLKMNGFKYDEDIKEMSICGGDLEIIHELEQNGISFDYCFEYSIMYQHHTITEWLLSNYKCEFFKISKCLYYFNHKAFLFLYLNQFSNKISNITLLRVFCSNYHINYDVLKYFIEQGVLIKELLQY